MDLKLIEKLTRLANNNPNEHEANAAARKVCKLLEEDNFQFSLNITRTKTPDFKSTRNPFYTPNNYDIFDEYLKIKFDKNPYYTQSSKSKPKSEERERTCVNCGRTVMTKRITNIFKCNGCEWNEFLKRNVVFDPTDPHF